MKKNAMLSSERKHQEAFGGGGPTRGVLKTVCKARKNGKKNKQIEEVGRVCGRMRIARKEEGNKKDELIAVGYTLR